MANYPYIIASFPDLVLDDEKHPVDERAVIAEVKGQLSEKDGQLVDWLEFGLEGSHLKSHFYRNIRQTGCRFLIDWFEFDRQLRLAKVAYLDNKPYPEDFPELEKADIVFKVDNLAQREKLLDRLNWDKCSSTSSPSTRSCRCWCGSTSPPAGAGSTRRPARPSSSSSSKK